ncbi:MAG: radical SAM protein [Candidatus Eremiobacteraeota bacterium]|nr:radical SAM protein [Candidatus Eremiobacteraeota bacterium]
MSIPCAVIWEITKQCNFNCAHCVVCATAKRPDDEMTTEMAKRFTEKFADIGGRQIFFSGGEPLLRDDLEEIMNHAGNFGFHSFSIASNGSVLNEKRLKTLIKAGVNNMQFSLDGATPEENASIRGAGIGAFEKILRAIRLTRDAGISVTVGTFFNPRNIDSIPDMVELCRREKVPMLRFSGFIPLGRGRCQEVIDGMKFSWEQIERFLKFICSYDPYQTGVQIGFDHAFGPFMERNVCTAGKQIFYLSSNGDIYPCPSFLHPDFKCGNAFENSLEDLKDILESKKMKSCQVRADEITGECAQCEDLQWCKGGCRGVAYAYKEDIRASFPNCLRKYLKYLPAIMPEPTRQTEKREMKSDREQKASGRKYRSKYKKKKDDYSLPANMPKWSFPTIEEKYRFHAECIKYMVKNHPFNYLLWESTLNCNFNCTHCSSPRENWKKDREMTTEQAKNVFKKFADQFDLREIQTLGITGGEPTLRPDLLEMISYLVKLGFRVAIDTNGFITGKNPDFIKKLEQAGLRNICISLDGMREELKAFRGVDGFPNVVKTIETLIDRHPRIFTQTITMVTQYNFKSIDRIFKLLENMGVPYARFGTVMAIGRAPGDEMNFLDRDQTRKLLHWIAGKRDEYLLGKTKLEIEFTDNGWCGKIEDPFGFEGLVRQGYFMCTAGIGMGIVTYDGKFGGCLSVPPELNIQGDLLTEDPRHIWETRFKVFRDKNRLHTGQCIDCDQWDYCLGGGMHERDLNLRLKGCTYQKIKF